MTGDHAEAGAGGDGLDLYAYAYLAGRERRVLESAVVVLAERGVLSLAAGRLRVMGGEPPQDPVELAVVAACPRSKPVGDVLDGLRGSPEIEALVRRLVSLGLVRNRPRGTSRAGRRCLASAVSEGRVPPYVLHGPAALDPGPVRYGLAATGSGRDGLGRTLRRMGKALDDPAHAADGGADGGGFGGGGGGGGD
ncbi:TIGR04222 domain-containing membrane protein [Streptomyces sp. NPDC058052]|uniref:TIGR04222 domain-containing membrane protein n=1 Tax=Streptomyces sp. NPDC058052 TaxID=3346316 RepID=UPI0036E393B9